MKSNGFSDILRLIFEVSFIYFLTFLSENILLRIITFFLSLFFVSVFYPKSENRSKGVPVRGNFKIITEIIMVLAVIVFSYQRNFKIALIFIVLGLLFLYFSKQRFMKLKAIE